MKKYNYFDDEADEIEEVKKSNSIYNILAKNKEVSIE